MTDRMTLVGPAGAARAQTRRPIPEAVERTLGRLARVRPDEAVDARAALGAALRRVSESAWPEVAWRSSNLTATGFPVELAWTSRDTSLRWTCEVAGPEVSEARRLGLCAELAEDLTGSAVDASPWSEVQHVGPLRWGAWLGMRHHGGERSGKVYLEVPPGADLPRCWRHPTHRLAAVAPGLRWRMAGCNDDGSVEVYARAPALTASQLSTLGGLVGGGTALVELVSRLLSAGPTGEPLRPGSPVTLAVPPRPSGVSLAMAPDGTPLSATWFGLATSLWSSDERADATVTALARTAHVGCGPPAVTPVDGSLELYRAMSGGAADGRWRHGMVGAGVDLTGGTWLQAGVRPT